MTIVPLSGSYGKAPRFGAGRVRPTVPVRGSRYGKPAGARPVHMITNPTYGKPGVAGMQPSSPAAAPAAATSPGSPPAQQPASPLDAQYYNNVANNQFKVNNQVNGLNLQGAQDQTALQATLAQLAYQQPRQQLQLEQQANQRGGLYSSVYGQNLGNLNYQFAGRQAGAQSNYSNAVSRIASQIAALHGGEDLYNKEQYGAAVERATTAAQKNPALGQDASLPPQASPVAQAATGGVTGRTGAAAGLTKGLPGRLYGVHALARSRSRRPVVRVRNPQYGKPGY